MTGITYVCDSGCTHPFAQNAKGWGTINSEKRVGHPPYMHRDPVKRGLVLEPEQWRWSSFRSYAYGEAGAVKINGWEILKMRVRAAGGS